VVVRDWRVPVKGGKRFALPANEGGNLLHGGAEGLGRLVWDAEPDDATNAVAFSLTSPHGAMGFPGTVALTATYRLSGNRLRLELGATTDRPTPLSLVQHIYFNLGTGNDVLDHRYRLAAHAYTEVGDGLIPTGNIFEIAPGSVRDFTTPRTLRDAQGGPLDYDGNWVLDAGRDPTEPIAVVTAPDGALTLRQWSDRPGLQFYNGVTTDVPVPGLHGRRYGRHSGFCLEDQAFPDAVHHPHFPSIVITPDRPYAHWCEFEIA
jgi:aldose 1-epimerase